MHVPPCRTFALWCVLALLMGCGDALFLDPAPVPNALAGVDSGSPPGEASGVSVVLVSGEGADGGSIQASGRPGAVWTSTGPVIFFASELKGKHVVRGASCATDGGYCTGFLAGPGDPKVVSAAANGAVSYAAWSEDGVVTLVRCEGVPIVCAVPFRSAQTDLSEPSIAVHPPTGEVFVAVAGTEGRHGVLRCDGLLSACTYFPVGALSGLPAGAGLAPRITMHEDSAQPRYHMLSHTTAGALYELSCDLDGTDCLPKADVPAKVAGSPLGYAGVVDDAFRRFVGVASTAGGGTRSFSFLVDYDAVAVASSAIGEPAAVDAFLDAPRGRFVVAAGGGVFRCSADGTGCAEALASSNAASSAAYDPGSGTTHVFSVRADGAIVVAKVGP